MKLFQDFAKEVIELHRLSVSVCWMSLGHRSIHAILSILLYKKKKTLCSPKYLYIIGHYPVLTAIVEDWFGYRLENITCCQVLWGKHPRGYWEFFSWFILLSTDYSLLGSVVLYIYNRIFLFVGWRYTNELDQVSAKAINK